MYNCYIKLVLLISFISVCRASYVDCLLARSVYRPAFIYVFDPRKFRTSNVIVIYTILFPFLNFDCSWLLSYEERGHVERSTTSLRLWIPLFHSTFGSWSRQPSVYAAFLCGILKTGTGNDEQGRAFQLPKQTILLQAPPGEAHVSSDIVQPVLPA